MYTLFSSPGFAWHRVAWLDKTFRGIHVAQRNDAPFYRYTWYSTTEFSLVCPEALRRYHPHSILKQWCRFNHWPQLHIKSRTNASEQSAAPFYRYIVLLRSSAWSVQRPCVDTIPILSLHNGVDPTTALNFV